MHGEQIPHDVMEAIEKHRRCYAGENPYRVFCPDLYNADGSFQEIGEKVLTARMSAANAVMAAYLWRQVDAIKAREEDRARPIDEEWLASIGGEFLGVWWHIRLAGRRELLVSQRWTESDVLLKNVASDHFVALHPMKTRGQLLDLLAALKGGNS